MNTPQIALTWFGVLLPIFCPGFSIWENSGGLIADSTTVTSCKKLVEYAEKSTSTEDLTKEDESIKIETVKDEDTVEIIKHWDSITLNHVETLGSSTCSERSSRWHGEYVDDEGGFFPIMHLIFYLYCVELL